MFWLGFLLVYTVLVGAEKRIVNNYIIHAKQGRLMRVKQTDNSTGFLNLASMDLMAIDVNCFENATNLKTLILAKNHFYARLPHLAFRSLSKLEYLSLACCDIQQVQYVFWGLKRLKTLDLRNNYITDWKNGSFYGLSNTTELLLSGNRLVTIQPAHFAMPFTLLSLCKFRGIVHSLQTFNEHTEEANRTRTCSITYIPLKNTVLDLSVKKIIGFKEGWYQIGEATGVRTLNLSQNKIKFLTAELLNSLPESVKTVNLSWNRIKSVSANVTYNRNMRELVLRGNPLNDITPYAFEDTALEERVVPSDS